MNTFRLLKRPFMRIFLIILGAITVLFVGLIVWTCASLYSGPGTMELSEFLPFGSAKAKEQYLAMYDANAKAWSVDSETRNIETSFGQTFVRISGPVDGPSLVLLPGGGVTSL